MQYPCPPPDVGAQAMQSTAAIGEAGTIAAAQLIGGLSGMMVSEGLNRLLREMMVAAPSDPPKASEEKAAGKLAESGEKAAAKLSESEALAEQAAKAFREMVMQGAVGRIMALQTVNTYLSMATTEQLRRWGAELLGSPAGEQECGRKSQTRPAAPAPKAPPYGAMPAPSAPWAPCYPYGKPFAAQWGPYRPG